MIKIITGFREDQYYTISDDEAHKAYYLFLNPDARTVFSNGVTLIGSKIQGIEPDYIATMGWNKGYQLGPDDWAEIRQKEIDRKLRNVLEDAQKVAFLCQNNPRLLNLKLSAINLLEVGENKKLLS